MHKKTYRRLMVTHISVLCDQWAEKGEILSTFRMTCNNSRCGCLFRLAVVFLGRLKRASTTMDVNIFMDPARYTYVRVMFMETTHQSTLIFVLAG